MSAASRGSGLLLPPTQRKRAATAGAACRLTAPFSCIALGASYLAALLEKERCKLWLVPGAEVSCGGHATYVVQSTVYTKI